MFVGDVSLAAFSDVVVIYIMKLGSLIVRDVEKTQMGRIRRCD